MDSGSQQFETGFTAEELDLTSNILPIAEYVEDRSEMITQMVSALRLPILRKLLPAALRRIPLDEIKEVLFHELSSIPRKEVLDLLADGAGYIPFAESIRRLQQSVEDEMEKPAVLKPSPLLKPDGASEKLSAVARPDDADINGVADDDKIDAILRDAGFDPSDENFIQKLLAGELGSKYDDDEAIRARLIRRLIDRHRGERVGAEVSTSSPSHDILDKYDDSAVYGINDADNELLPGPDDAEDENLQLDGFEKRRTEGKSFRARLKTEPPDQLAEEQEGGDDVVETSLGDHETLEFPSIEPADGSPELDDGEELRKSKKKKNKHRHHKKKRRYRRSDSSDGYQDDDSRLSTHEKMLEGRSVVVEVVKLEPVRADRDDDEAKAASEEGELETDEEIEQLVETRRRKEEERAKKLKQLEILKRIAPDEYYFRLREMQEEEGYGDDEEDRRSESSSEDDPSMPWNDPNYGKASRCRRSTLIEHVERPTNPMEVTNPAPQNADF